VGSHFEGVPMKPIAMVHWTDKNEREKAKDFYDVMTLNRFVDMLNRQNLVSVTTMQSLHARIPTTAPRRHIIGA